MTEEELLFKQFKEFMKSQNQKDSNKRVFYRRSRGTGSIYKNSGKRKKPFVVTVTIGRNDETGQQIKKCLGSFKSREEAENALSIYNLHKNGFLNEQFSEALSRKNLAPTFSSVWDKIFIDEIEVLSRSAQKNYKTAYNNLSEIHDIPLDKLDMHLLQPLFDDLATKGAGYSKLNNMKVVINKVFTYAMKYDYVNKNYADYITFTHNNEKTFKHFSFSHDEITKLWSSNSLGAKIVLIFIYTGLRPIELIKIKNEDIHLEESYMIGGAKTSNGKNRIIPIHNSILPLIKGIMNPANKYLILEGSEDYYYNKYRQYIFRDTIKSLNLNDDHMPYDTRHTFATLCNENGLDDFLVKKIIGHSVKDLTKGTYTHVEIQRLVDEVNKLPTFC